MNDLQDITIPFSFLGGGEGVSEGDLKAKSPLSHSPNRPIGFTAALHKDLTHENLPLNGSFAARAYAASTSGKLAAVGRDFREARSRRIRFATSWNLVAARH